MNTFSKRKLCVGASTGIYTHLREMNKYRITHYIPSERFTKMENIFCTFSKKI